MNSDSNIADPANIIDKIQIGLNNVKSEITIGLKKVEFQLQESLEERSKLIGHVKLSASNTDHGLGIYNNLKSAGKIIIPPEGDGPPVIDSELIQTATEMYNQTLKRPHEKELVNLYTPSLMQVVNEVSPDLRLVNSEAYAWLRCSSGHPKSDLKPDLFSAYHPLVEFRSAYANAPTCAMKRLFGKFTSWESRSSLHCIWDAKWRIDWDAFGEMCKYLQIAGEDCSDFDGYLLRLKGVLFDVNQFWMITSHGNAISEVVMCKWSQSGSKQLLVDFLSNLDPWQKAATALCGALGVAIRDFSVADEGEETAFLGSGANGRVFRLRCGAALKIVLGKKSNEVEKEYKLMLECQKKDKIQPFVFPVQEGSYRSGSADPVDYAGYILTRIGHRISPPPLSIDVKLKLVEALYGLHSNNVIHGDPRIDNALILDDGTSAASVRWIDFRDVERVTTKISIRRDVEILFKSMDGSSSIVEDVAGRIRDYMNDPTLDKLRTVFSC